MAGGTRNVSVWIDIENAPQVRYLLPFVEAFRIRGADVILTARDHGSALDLLNERDVSFDVVGAEIGRSKVAKTLGALKRAQRLASLVRRKGRPNVSLSASRASALAARSMRISSFVIVDYEYANLTIYRLTASTIFHPEAIDSAALRRAGIHKRQLMAFRGLKEDISLRAEDVDTASDAFPQIADGALIRVLFRPPAETSHYYEPESRDLALRALEYLAAQPEAVLVFLPRHHWQLNDLNRLNWSNPPVVLDRPIPTRSLFGSVDLIVCSGGTMLREAAYLGLPAYSILRSRIGAVDRYLASIGRVRFVRSPDELATIELRKAVPGPRLESNPQLLEQLADIVLKAAENAPD
jgi:predicted glycosyltransferase